MGQNIPPAPFSSATPKFGSKIPLQGIGLTLLPLSIGIAKADGECTASRTAGARLALLKSTPSSTPWPREAAESLITPGSQTQNGLGPAVLPNRLLAPNGLLASQHSRRDGLITGVILPVAELPPKPGALLPSWLKA